MQDIIQNYNLLYGEVSSRIDLQKKYCFRMLLPILNDKLFPLIVWFRDMNEDDALRYDRMINWDVRLAREMPIITQFLPKGLVLDMACSSGRHSRALVDEGYQTIGVDINETFVTFAKNLVPESKFITYDAASNDLHQQFGETIYCDGAIMLGNAIANFGTIENCTALIRNIYRLLKPGGIFFTQTVNRPSQPHYLPLRDIDGAILQRIMMPYIGEEFHNTELHINIIKDMTYISKETKNKFYMFTKDEFATFVKSHGFEIIEMFGGYDMSEATEEGGKDTLWVLKKPEMEISDESIALIGLDKNEISEKLLSIWQDLHMSLPYHCVNTYRIIHPRILVHPKYSKIDWSNKRVLDIGCAMGADLEQIILDGGNPNLLFGVDIEKIPITSRNILFKEKGIHFYVGDVMKDDLVDMDGNEIKLFTSEMNKFDVIYTGSLIHLLSKTDADELISKIHAGLLEGGIFFGRVVVLEYETEEPISYFKYLYTLKDFKQLLTDAGFNNIEIQTIEKPHKMEASYGNQITVFYYCIK